MEKNEIITNQNNDGTIIEQIFEFFQEVFIGIETKVYSMNKENNDLEKLKTNEGMLIGANILEYYLNQLYRALIEKQDEFILNKFQIYGDFMDLKPVFALNLCTNVIMKCYPMLPRKTLDTENEQKYIESLKSQTNLMKKYMLMRFDEDLKTFHKEKKNIPNEEN